jgi:hypothetical protein
MAYEQQIVGLWLRRAAAGCLVLAAWCCAAVGGEPVPKPAAPPKAAASVAAIVVKEEDLERRDLPQSDLFRWPKSVAKQPVQGPKPDNDAVPDMMAGEVLIRSVGVFTRVAPQANYEQEFKDSPELLAELRALAKETVIVDKEILTLTKDVEIDQLQPQATLRGQKITVVRDLKTGRTELLQAIGSVELSTPERKGKGDRLVYRTEFTPQGQILKDEYTLKGNRATLWSGDDDVIEAAEFFSDRRLDTFRVRGAPVAIVKMPGAPKPAAAAVTPEPGPSGILGGFANMSSGKIRMRCDGEMFYEGPGGQVRITRNVVIQQDALGGGAAVIMTADDAALTLLPPPPGQAADQGSVFSGSLKTLECNGRVEIKMPGQVMLCDRGVLDMQRKTFLMDMKNSKADVLIFMREDANGGKKMVIPRSFKISLETGETQAGGPQRMERYTGEPPSNRTPPAATLAAPKSPATPTAPKPPAAK